MERRERMHAHAQCIEGAGGRALQQQLLSTSAPLELISEFQQTHSLAMFEGLQPALAFLQNLEVNRSGTLLKSNQLILDSLKATLTGKIRSASQEKLLELLDSTHGFIASRDLKSIPLTILSQLREIPVKYLKFLTHPKIRHILPELPLGVRHKAWEVNPPMFLEEMHRLWTVEAMSVPKQRRASVVAVCDAVSNNEVLFGVLARQCCDRVMAATAAAAVAASDEGKCEGDGGAYRSLLRFSLVRLQDQDKKLPAFMRVHELSLQLETVERAGKLTEADVTTTVQIVCALVQNQQAIEGKSQSHSQGGVKGVAKSMSGGARPAQRPASRPVPRPTPIPTPVAKLPPRPAVARAVAPKALARAPIPPLLLSTMKEAWTYLTSLDSLQIFKDAPDVRTLPGYLNVVSQEKIRDLKSIAGKVDKVYTSFEVMDDDVCLMVANCMAYVAPGTVFHAAAVEMRDLWAVRANEIRSRLGLDVRDVPPPFVAPATVPHLAPRPTVKKESLETKPRKSGGGGGGGGTSDDDDDFKMAVDTNADDGIDSDSGSDSDSGGYTRGASLAAAIVPARAAAAASQGSGGGGSREVAAEELEQPLLRCHSWLEDLDEQHFFRLPVTDAMAPNYSREIAYPIDLFTIHSKIGAFSYSSLDDFDHDVVAMFTNCMQYNGYDQDFGLLADSMLRQWCLRAEEAEKEIYGPEGGRRVSFPAALQAILVGALAFMTAVDDEGWFKYPVNNVPGYSAVVPHPRDLCTIRHNIWRHKYVSVAQFSADIELMLSNAIAYNGAESPVGMLATSHRRIWHKHQQEAQEAQTALQIPREWQEMYSCGAAIGAGAGAGAASPVIMTLDKALATGWQFLTDLDRENIFAQPVKAATPNYYKVIPPESARDMATMAGLRRRRGYGCLKHFADDVRLMLNNCTTFNGEDSIYGQTAQAFLTAWTAKEAELAARMAEGPDAALVNMPAASFIHTESKPRPVPIATTTTTTTATAEPMERKLAPRPVQKKRPSASLGMFADGQKRSRPACPSQAAANDGMPAMAAGLNLLCAMVLLSDPVYQKLLLTFVVERLWGGMHRGLLPNDDPLVRQAVQLLQLPFVHNKSLPGPPLLALHRLLPQVVLSIASAAEPRALTLADVAEGCLTGMGINKEEVQLVEWKTMLKVGAAAGGALGARRKAEADKAAAAADPLKKSVTCVLDAVGAGAGSQSQSQI